MKIQEKSMFAVKGIYSGGNTVRLEQTAIPVEGQCEVIVTFLNPEKQAETNTEAYDLAKRQAGFQKLMKYHKTLRADFDYQKELAEARDEKYGRPD
jgi:hypothetical protein